MENLHNIWIGLRSSNTNGQRKLDRAQHGEFYPLYKTELTEALEQIKTYVNTKNRLKENSAVVEFIEFLKDKSTGLTNLTQNTNKTGVNFVYSDDVINSIIPINYGMPILENILKGADALLNSLRIDMGNYAHARAILAEHEYFFDDRYHYGIAEPDMSMFYNDFEEQDNGVTKDMDVIMPSLNDTDAVKTLKNGDYEVRVYLIYDRNRPRTCRGLGGKRFIIKDGVNRYKKACEQWEQDKKAWHARRIVEYKQEHAQDVERYAHALKTANDTLMALDTVLMPISIIATLIGINKNCHFYRNKGAYLFDKFYSAVTNSINYLCNLNEIKYLVNEDLTQLQLAQLNEIACRYTSYYGHQTRAEYHYYRLKQTA